MRKGHTNWHGCAPDTTSWRWWEWRHQSCPHRHCSGSPLVTSCRCPLRSPPGVTLIQSHPGTLGNTEQRVILSVMTSAQPHPGTLGNTEQHVTLSVMTSTQSHLDTLGITSNMDFFTFIHTYWDIFLCIFHFSSYDRVLTWQTATWRSAKTRSKGERDQPG